MNKKAKLFSITLAVLFLVKIPVFAQPQGGGSQSETTQLQQDKSTVESIQDKRQELEGKIEHFDVQIEEAMRKAEENKNKIAVTEKDIETTERDILKIENDLNEKKQIAKERVRTMYINGGGGSYVELLLSSSGLDDFISRTEALVKIMQFDKTIFSQLDENKVSLEEKKGELEEENQKLLALSKENEAQLLKLQEDKKEQNELLIAIRNEEELLSGDMQSSQAKIDRILKQINNSKSATVSFSRGSTFSSNELISYAAKFIGTPYLWGGTNPTTGFDCSGFTQYVYAHFGVSLGRTTYDQINDGPSVSKSELRPGDLVFFGTISDPHHMGIYIGDNYYIHSPRTGDVLKISVMDRSDFVKGVRVR